jgi:hypothetical protein
MGRGWSVAVVAELRSALRNSLDQLRPHDVELGEFSEILRNVIPDLDLW